MNMSMAPRLHFYQYTNILLNGFHLNVTHWGFRVRKSEVNVWNF